MVGWDGRDDAGKLVGSGVYFSVVAGITISGQQVRQLGKLVYLH